MEIFGRHSHEFCRQIYFLIALFQLYSDLESIINGLTPPQAPFTLGNTSFLLQETTQERQALYSQLVNSYKWIDKV